MSAESIAPAPPIPSNQQSTLLRQAAVQDYLDRERDSEIRHEYVEGEIIAMAGETPAHNVIAGNLFFSLRFAIGNRSSSVYFENIRLRVSPSQYRYPDVMALCSKPQFDEDNPPALLNPSLIIEVLSPSTQATDRTEKFLEYRKINSLTDYVLVAQDTLSVIHYVRQSARYWGVTEYAERTDTLTFTSLEVTMTLADIYRQITFPEETSAPAK